MSTLQEITHNVSSTPVNIFAEEFFLMGLIIGIILLLPFVFFTTGKEQCYSKARIGMYCLIGWILLYGLLSYYSRINIFYTLKDFTALGMITDQSGTIDKATRPAIFSMSPMLHILIIYSVMFFGWLYFLMYYFIFKFINISFIKNKPGKK